MTKPWETLNTCSPTSLLNLIMPFNSTKTKGMPHYTDG